MLNGQITSIIKVKDLFLYKDIEQIPVLFITTTEAANILGISPKSSGFLVRSGKIPGVKLANRWLVSRAAAYLRYDWNYPGPARPG